MADTDPKDARPLALLADEMRELGHESFRKQYGSLFLCFNTWEVRSQDSDSTTLEPPPEGGAAGGQTAPTTFWVLPLRAAEKGAPVRVGRDEVCDVVLSDQSISGDHATFQIDGDEVRLWDAGSKNGTFIKDEMIARLGQAEPALLEGERCALRFGSLNVVFFRFGALVEAARLLGLDPGDA